jgi:hypothetical protein
MTGPWAQAARAFFTQRSVPARKILLPHKAAGLPSAMAHRLESPRKCPPVKPPREIPHKVMYSKENPFRFKIRAFLSKCKNERFSSKNL